MEKKHQGRVTVVYGTAAVLTVTSLILYGWKATGFVSEYIPGQSNHIWLSSQQMICIQPLLAIGVLIGVFQRLPYLVGKWLDLKSSSDAKLSSRHGSRSLRFSLAVFLTQGLPALLIMEFPYLLAVMGKVIYGSPYSLIPSEVLAHMGWGDFIVSSLAAVWLGSTVAGAFEADYLAVD